jgi:hypothetical protein
MKYFEIILKIAFLALAIYVIATRQVFGEAFMILTYIAFILGVVLIFNKKQSYNYPANYPKIKNVFMMRRIEGIILVLCALVIFLHS